MPDLDVMICRETTGTFSNPDIVLVTKEKNDVFLEEGRILAKGDKIERESVTFGPTMTFEADKGFITGLVDAMRLAHDLKHRIECDLDALNNTGAPPDLKPFLHT